MNRREALRGLSALAGVPSVIGGLSARTQEPVEPAGSEDTLRFFPGFRPFMVATTGATINGVIGGQGSPVLLLHGAPQTHVSWRLVAPNSRITADSGQGYESRSAAHRAAETVRTEIGTASIGDK